MYNRETGPGESVVSVARPDRLCMRVATLTKEMRAWRRVGFVLKKREIRREEICV